MMKKKAIYIGLTIVAALTGCTRKLADDSSQNSERIAVCAGIGEPSIVTRAEYIYTTPSEEHPLDAQVWFSADPAEFANSGSATSLPRHSEIEFVSGEMTFPTTDILPYASGSSTYAVGFWPKTAAWNANGAYTQVTCAIDGTDDLMFAPKIEATEGNHFTTAAPLTFGHLLTWVKIRVTAANSEAITAWGNITDIIVSSSTSLTVTLGNGSVAYNTLGTITGYSNVTGTALTTNSQELCSLFCAPTDNAQYTIKVKSANEPEGKSVDVNLTDLGGSSIGSGFNATKGKEFIITLTFQPFNMIDAVGKSLASWENENVPITGSDE